PVWAREPADAPDHRTREPGAAEGRRIGTEKPVRSAHSASETWDRPHGTKARDGGPGLHRARFTGGAVRHYGPPLSVGRVVEGPRVTGQRTGTRLPTWLALLLVAVAGLLLEVGYTRIASYKLWYYYTYLVIGLSLLGIGSGGIVVAIWKPIRRVATERIIAVASIWGAVNVAAGY